MRRPSRPSRFGLSDALLSAAVLAVLAFPGRPAVAAATVAADDALTLALPHPLRQGEAAFVEVTVGPITRSQRVEVTTADGRPIGTVSPFGIRAGEAAGTYAMPVPADAIRDGTVSLRLRIIQGNAPPRTPTAEEVKGVKLSIAGSRP